MKAIFETEMDVVKVTDENGTILKGLETLDDMWWRNNRIIEKTTEQFEKVKVTISVKIEAKE